MRIGWSIVFVLLSCFPVSQALSQLENPKLTYHDSLIVIDHDSLRVLCGSNPEFGLRFISRSLYDQVEYSKTYSRKPIDDLFQFSGEGYLGLFPDTSGWKLFSDGSLGLSFRYPSNLQAHVNHQTKTIELMSGSRTCLHLSVSNSTFAQHILSLGWIPKYQGISVVFVRGPRNAAYLEADNWKGLVGLEPAEGDSGAHTDNPEFLAVLTLNDQKSLVFELSCSDPDMLQEDLLAMLHSVELVGNR